MVLAGCKRRRLITLGLLLLIAACLRIPSAYGQQGGVSLKLHGVPIPNNSLVDFDDLLYRTASDPDPTNDNGLHDQTLVCVTDLTDCCLSPHTVRGDWYYPDGRVVHFDSGGTMITFRANRGPNEVRNGQQFYGSVRLFRRWSSPPERGRFYCELPSAADPSVNQTLYANILNIGPVTISSFGSSIAGENSSLVCSATIATQIDTPTPTFQWFYGPNNNSLPYGVTASATNNGSTYITTLYFAPLNESHAGMYTCRLGGNTRLAAHTRVIVQAPLLSVVVIAYLNVPLLLGQTGNILVCIVTGGDILAPTTSYQWTRNDGSTQTQAGISNILSLSPLTLSDAGNYTCTVSSTLLKNPVTANNILGVTIQIPGPKSVTITSSLGIIVHKGSNVTLICSVQMNEAVSAFELSLLVVNASLTRPDGSTLLLSNPLISDTTYSFITQVNSFGDSDVGNYTCTATIGPQPSSIFLTGIDQKESIPINIEIEIPHTSRGSNSGAIAGGVIVIIIIAAAAALTLPLALCIWCCLRKSSNKKEVTEQMYENTDALAPVSSSAVYEDPDKLDGTIAHDCEQRNYELTECPAYVSTTGK